MTLDKGPRALKEHIMDKTQKAQADQGLGPWYVVGRTSYPRLMDVVYGTYLERDQALDAASRPTRKAYAVYEYRGQNYDDLARGHDFVRRGFRIRVQGSPSLVLVRGQKTVRSLDSVPDHWPEADVQDLNDMIYTFLCERGLVPDAKIIEPVTQRKER